MPTQTEAINRTHTSRQPTFVLMSCLLVSCALAPAAFAAGNPGAHEHGQARLQMVLENNQIDLIFTSPAYNLAGFEYQARTDGEKKRLAEIDHWLATTPLINSVPGACTIAVVTVEPGDHGGTHRDYEIAQQLTCDGISSSGTFTSPLPGRFPGLEELTIEWVGPDGQGSTLITPESRTFSLNHSS
jgi:hypothetical protein